jgi:ATP-binding cassette subfamily C protein LapB
MQHLFENMPKESSIVVVTHKPSVLAYVSRILVLDKGRVVLDGPRDEVLNRLRQPSATPQAAPPSAAHSAAPATAAGALA